MKEFWNIIQAVLAAVGEDGAGPVYEFDNSNRMVCRKV